MYILDPLNAVPSNYDIKDSKDMGLENYSLWQFDMEITKRKKYQKKTNSENSTYINYFMSYKHLQGILRNKKKNLISNYAHKNITNAKRYFAAFSCKSKLVW